MAKSKILDTNKKTAEGLSKLLADTFMLYLKTHNFHWNVRGPMFQTLHLMFETQYTELWTSIDIIAERIRSLDADAPGTFSEFNKLTSIKEEKGIPKAMDMIKILIADNEKVVKTANDVFPIAEKAEDEPTQDLLIQRINTHEKTIWMLKAMLE
ncbi:MAG: DNA starvation/stationary phase protection protein [Ignavibacteria bacterium]|nr:DNA starvation/stationary phase protection protein [Ignavibacteria bacterium]